MSILIHGEAVRFNRGKSRTDDFDFKYLRGYDGKVFPYVSSQCFKKYWREALTSLPSPVIRQGRNQAFTLGDPVNFVDDDLFGYMVAGADAETEEDTEATESSEAVDETLERFAFQPDAIKQGGTPFLRRILESLQAQAEEPAAAELPVSADQAEPPAKHYSNICWTNLRPTNKRCYITRRMGK